jgi:hypothetical protein
VQRHSLESINIPLEGSLPFVSWIRFPRVAQRDDNKQANNRGTKEYLSSVKAKKAKRKEESGEKKRSKLRGGVESGLDLPDKIIEHAAKMVFTVARRAVRDDLSTQFQRRSGMRACNVAGLSTMRDAKLQIALHL